MVRNQTVNVYIVVSKLLKIYSQAIARSEKYTTTTTQVHGTHSNCKRANGVRFNLAQGSRKAKTSLNNR